MSSTVTTSPIGEFTNNIQDSLNFKEYYQDDNKPEKNRENNQKMK
jgi:hypothetical protein